MTDMSSARAGAFLAAACAILGWFYVRSAGTVRPEPPPDLSCEAPIQRGPSPADTILRASARLKDPGSMDGFRDTARQFDSLDAERSRHGASIGARRRCYAGMMRSAAKCMQYLHRAGFSLRNDLAAERELVAYKEACERYFDERIRQAYSTCYTSADEVYPLAGMPLSSHLPRASNDVFA